MAEWWIDAHGQIVATFSARPGPSAGMALPPRGVAPPTHAFATGNVRDPLREDEIGRILRASALTGLPHGGTPRVNMRIACTSKTSRRRRAA